MVSPTQGNGEFIADFATKSAVLREAQMMGIRGPPAADQARLLSHEFDVDLVTAATRLRVREPALIDAFGNGCLAGLYGLSLKGRRGLAPGRDCRR